MTLPPLMVITDVARYGVRRTLERVERLLAVAEPGRVVVQLRDRRLSARQRLAIGRDLRESTRRWQQLLSVNDRVDLALLLEADGVHLGEQSLLASTVRGWVGGRLRITRASHEPAIVGDDAAVDGWLLSPVFAPRKGKPALGSEGLACAQAELRARGSQAALYALGGVDPEQARHCQSLGIGVAVIGAAFEPADPAPLLDALGILA